MTMHPPNFPHSENAGLVRCGSKLQTSMSQVNLLSNYSDHYKKQTQQRDNYYFPRFKLLVIPNKESWDALNLLVMMVNGCILPKRQGIQPHYLAWVVPYLQATCGKSRTSLKDVNWRPGLIRIIPCQKMTPG